MAPGWPPATRGAPGLGAALPGLACSAVIAAAAAAARRHERGLDELSPAGVTEPGSPPAGEAERLVDAVVPARDEASRIARCVSALRRSVPAVRVTVVDDGSDDGTGELAARAGAEVVRAPDPPAGWLGKPHACHVGAATAAAPWLAFVDADTELAPWALAALVRHCLDRGLAAASPLLRQGCSLPADRLLVPFAFWQYMIGLPGGAQRRGRVGTRAILNGQCVVVRSDVYRATGGHGHPAVRGSRVEDSALARMLVSAGHRVGLVRGRRAGTVRMYRGAAEVRAGLGRSIPGFLAADPVSGAAVAAAGMALASVPALAARAALRRSWPAGAGAAAAFAAPLPALARVYSEAGESPALALAHPVASAGMQLIAVEALARAALGRPPRWRGRDVGRSSIPQAGRARP